MSTTTLPTTGSAAAAAEAIEIGTCSTDPIESLISRGYAFSCLPLTDSLDGSQGCSVSIVVGDDIHSIDSQVRQEALDRIKLDIGYLQHHSIHNVLMQAPLLPEHALLYAHSIAPLLRQFPYLELSLLIPLCPPTSVVDEPKLAAEIEDDPELLAEVEDDQLTNWGIWDEIRSVCNYHPRLHLALQLPPRLPSDVCMSRWLAEDVRYLVVSAGIFLVNQKGYPVLPKGHQRFIQLAAKFDPSILLEHTDKHQRLGGEDAYLQYVRYVLTHAPEPTLQERFAVGYADFLQQPLQPLQDDLSAVTYEVFEKDPCKYEKYEEAIALALQDRKGQRGRTVVAVVGAGRGPLVDCCLRAAARTGRPMKLYAVEKNAHACAGLRRRVVSDGGDWRGKVELVEGDMRLWEPEEYIDILVSELLGSFADNELSPECLDGVQRVLEPTSGISIPQRYTPYIQPIMTPRLYTALFNAAAGSSPSNTTVNRQGNLSKRTFSTDPLETPYVVLLSKFDPLSVNASPLWHFHHPADTATLSAMPADARQARNKRYGRCVFDVDRAGTCHGLAGYFEAVLYPGIELSTVPGPSGRQLKSPNLVSWFPMYLPIPHPLTVPRGGAVIEAHVWRDTDPHAGGRRVWYAWKIDVRVLDRIVATSGIINQHGESSSLAL
ncbi:hypothetical protein PYCC9005_005942 [Savitreella phatthalungensis]